MAFGFRLPLPASRLLAAIGASLALAGAVCAAAGLAPALAAAQPAAATVKIDNFSFGPQSLTVRSGTTVTWINQDDTPHTVVAMGGAFRSRPLDTEERFSFTFAKAGEYAYFCSLHPHMTGKVIVTQG